MALEPVHVMEMDRSTSRLELTRVNPTRVFLVGGPTGLGIYTWQNGKWYDTGEQEVVDVSTVPQHCRDEIEANRPAVTTAGPTVTWTCKLCNYTGNVSETESHMLRHVDETMKAAGRIEEAKADAIPPPAEIVVEKKVANVHGRG